MFAMLTFRLMYSPGDVNTELLRAIALDMLCVKSTVTEMRGLIANNAALEARIAFLESQSSAAQEQKKQRDLKWQCPVCLEHSNMTMARRTVTHAQRRKPNRCLDSGIATIA